MVHRLSMEESKQWRDDGVMSHFGTRGGIPLNKNCILQAHSSVGCIGLQKGLRVPVNK
jgi:hypothetical protein